MLEPQELLLNSAGWEHQHLEETLGYDCRGWKKLSAGCFTIKAEVLTCSMVVMAVQMHFSPLRALDPPTVSVSVMTQMNPLAEIPFKPSQLAPPL